MDIFINKLVTDIIKHDDILVDLDKEQNDQLKLFLNLHALKALKHSVLINKVISEFVKNKKENGVKINTTELLGILFRLERIFKENWGAPVNCFAADIFYLYTNETKLEKYSFQEIDRLSKDLIKYEVNLVKDFAKSLGRPKLPFSRFFSKKYWTLYQ